MTQVNLSSHPSVSSAPETTPTLGLTNWFPPPQRSNQSVLQPLLWPLQDLSFFTTGIPMPVPGRYYRFYECFYPEVGRPYWGFLDFRNLGLNSPQAPHQFLEQYLSALQHGMESSSHDTRLEFGIRQPGNAGQKYLLTCHPASGRQETAGLTISRQTPKLQLILVHIYRLRLNLLQNQRRSFQFHYGSHVCHVCKQNAHGGAV